MYNDYSKYPEQEQPESGHEASAYIIKQLQKENEELKKEREELKKELQQIKNNDFRAYM